MPFRSMRRSIGALVLFCVSVAGSPTSGADLAAGRVLHFCFEDWPPYLSTQDGQAAGPMAEIALAAAARLGRSADFTDLPYGRCLQSVAQGSFDAILTADDQPDLIAAGPPIAWWNLAAVVRTDWPSDVVHSLEDFRGHRVAKVTNYNDYGVAVDGFTGWDIEYTPDASTSLRMLDAGRVDIVPEDPDWVEIERRNAHLAVKLLHPDLAAVPQFVMFGQSRADIATAFGSALAAVIADGTADGALYGSLPHGIAIHPEHRQP
jgi:ABC-type amino acid transport substrate-binding protein